MSVTLRWADTSLDVAREAALESGFVRGALTFSEEESQDVLLPRSLHHFPVTAAGLEAVFGHVMMVSPTMSPRAALAALELADFLDHAAAMKTYARALAEFVSGLSVEAARDALGVFPPAGWTHDASELAWAQDLGLCGLGGNTN